MPGSFVRSTPRAGGEAEPNKGGKVYGVTPPEPRLESWLVPGFKSDCRYAVNTRSCLVHDIYRPIRS
jgi:hypothetical protein